MDQLTALATNPQAWAALLTLIVMEVVLGIDNLVFVALLSNSLPEAQRRRARGFGLGLALGLRLVLLSTLVFIVGLTQSLFTAFGHDFSWRDLILAAGGLFLLYKATTEIHQTLEPAAKVAPQGRKAAGGFAMAIVQILLLDLVFSVDSILTAVGMTDQLPIMIVAVVVAVLLMMLASGPLAAFIHDNPTVVMLALGFLLMIGMTLIAEAFGAHVPKGYIYAAMAFAGFVEALNILARKRGRAEP